jgi:hypothetical protein
LQWAKVGRNVDNSGTNWGGEGRGLWTWTERVLSRVHALRPDLFCSGCEAAWRYLPSREDALSRFRMFGMSSMASPRDTPTAASSQNLVLRLARRAGRAVKYTLFGSGFAAWYQRDLPYPLAYGISDFFVVRKSAAEKFSTYCGALAALDVFVEAAVPTALVLACDKLGTGDDTSLKCKWTWSGSGVSIGSQAAFDYSTICQEFDENLLFIHPVKFSQVAV